MEIVHPFLGIFYASMSLGKGDKSGNLFFGNSMVFDLKSQGLHLFIARTVERKKNRKCEFAFCHVITRGFANV